MQYVVHSSHKTAVDVPAKTAAGAVVTGKMAALIAELLPQSGVGSTLTLTIIVPDEKSAQAAVALYEVGSVLDLTVTRAKG